MAAVWEWFQSGAVRALRLAFLERLGGVRALFTSRHGGVTPPPLGPLNLSYHVGDEPARVVENRRRAMALAGASLERAVVAGLVHGTAVARVDGPVALRGPGEAPGDPSGYVPGYDALITATAGLALMVTSADCVPIYIYDPRRRAAGLAHAGWRGSAGAIARRTVAELAACFGSRPADLWAVVGPAIGPCCYEVDEPVRAAFAAAAEPGWEAWFRPGARDGRWQLDLWSAARDQLRGAGVPGSQVALAGVCTACQAGDFFSHRWEGGRAGRQAAILMLEEVPGA